MLRDKSITISVPSYNDAGTLLELIRDFNSFLLINEYVDFSFLIIDDGSEDNTENVIQLLIEEVPSIKYIKHETNLGFGPTFLETFQLPKTELVFFVTGDYQFGVDSFFLMIEKLQEDNSDIVYGVREHRKDSFVRRINSWVYNSYIRLVSGQHPRDVNSIILYKSAILDHFTPFSSSAFINAELFLFLVEKKVKISYCDIPHRYRKLGIGAGGKLKVILPVIRDSFLYLLKRFAKWL